MDKNKIISDSRLRKVFKDIPMENLSAGFMENLMSKIEKEAVRKRKINALIVFLQIAAGIASMILLPMLAIHLCNLFIPEFSFSNIHINISANSVIIGLAALLLLIIDSICQKYMTNGNKLKTK